MSKSKKHPWNPFPLASLKVMDVSPCAKIVLIYLAARSNWKGETCAGVRTIARELMKSQRFVINGMKELREKEYLSQSQRDRRDNEADWKTLTKKVLSPSASLPVGEPNAPAVGEANALGLSANVEAEPYRLRKDFNLADENLTGFEVSKQVSSLRLSQDVDLLGFEAEENPNPITGFDDEDADEVEFVHSDKEIAEELGKCFPVFKSLVKPTPEDIRLMREIVAKCDDWCMYPSRAMEFARKHKQNKPALIPSSVQRLWDATCGDVSSTNGLLAQTSAHKQGECLICKMAIKGVMCSCCGKGNVFYKPDGVVSDYCSECSKLPSYRLESGQREILKSDI